MIKSYLTLTKSTLLGCHTPWLEGQTEAGESINALHCPFSHDSLTYRIVFGWLIGWDTDNRGRTAVEGRDT
jgi:hypothetical protein